VWGHVGEGGGFGEVLFIKHEDMAMCGGSKLNSYHTKTITFQLITIVIKLININVLKEIPPDYLVRETKRKNNREKIGSDQR
jgi:ABC-type thiamin/hydroxymethylpyrimidine transport system permease subunit